jgi:hypothetical protein
MKIALTLACILFTVSCQTTPEEKSEPPHPANNKPEVVKQRANAQHQLDDAMAKGLHEKPRLKEVQRATVPTLPYDNIGARINASGPLYLPSTMR